MFDVSLRQECLPSIHQQQKLLMTGAMKQAFYVLQLPILELSEWLKTEIENNPALEMDLPDIDSDYTSFQTRKCSIQKASPQELLENLISSPISLFEHLMAQARFHFTDADDLNLAQWIIGHLNDRGFLSTSLSELSTIASVEKLEEILRIIQTFDPPGIGAHDLQASLLIQLQLKQKEHTFAYKIVENHFDDLINNRLPTISKCLNIPIAAISHIVEQDIASLNLHPGHRFHSYTAGNITPDIHFFLIENTWKVEINDAFLPTFHMAQTYKDALHQKRLTSEEQSCLRKYFTAGKWLRHILNKRRKTLLRIGQFLLKKQMSFFEEGRIIPLTMAEAAEALDVHESTIARAVSNKYAACPQGMFALKDFFNHSLRGTEGKKISHHTLRQKLKKLIDGEDKKKPYSDTAITKELKKIGVPCARRTVTKYRRLLSIASASKRKQWG